MRVETEPELMAAGEAGTCVGPHWDQTARHEALLEMIGIGPILESREVVRLKDVSFLSTIDHIVAGSRRYSRYDHSVSVAALAYAFAASNALREKDALILAVAALIHDVGHAPLSHAAETFLVERVRHYHEGLGTRLLRRCPEALETAHVGLRQRISSIGSWLFTGVWNLYVDRACEEPLTGLFKGATSFDTMDGVTRTAWSLGENSIDPCAIAGVFEVAEGRVVVPTHCLGVLEEFWDLKVRMYRDWIYTARVLAAEAMITRALEATLTDADKSDIHRFLESTDAEAFEMMESHELGRDLVKALRERKLFQSLAAMDNDTVESVRTVIDHHGGRMAFDVRKTIEREIAEAFHVDAGRVITHFSFTREFDGSHLQGQRSLAFGCKGDIAYYDLDDLRGMFRRTRASGSRFDIFVPSDTKVDFEALNQIVRRFERES